MKKIYAHGLGQTPGSWEKTIERLGDAEDSVCPDLTKMNLGGKDAYRGLYEAFSAECDRWDGPALCGLSLGGVLALNYAVEHPEKVSALILIAAQYKMPKLLLTMQNAVFRLMPQGVFRQMGSTKSGIISLCGSMAELDFSGSLHKITCPTLIVCGERDQANRRASEEMAGEIRGAKLVTVKGAGHEINTQAPEELAKILRDFYKACHKMD